MSVHRVLTWLCERPQGDFTLGWALRKGWPEFASIVLLPKQLELGRAARLVERVIFLGAMAGFIFYGGLPLGSLGRVSGSGGSRLYKTQTPIKETGFLGVLHIKTHIYCVIILMLHCRSHGSRNPGGLPRSMVSCFESRNREASDLPLDALL